MNKTICSLVVTKASSGAEGGKNGCRCERIHLRSTSVYGE